MWWAYSSKFLDGAAHAAGVEAQADDVDGRFEQLVGHACGEEPGASNAELAALWAAVGDQALFGCLAAHLERVEVVDCEGEGLVRRCVARGGADWTETCTMWDPGHRHAVEVDPSGYPYPLATVGCLSYVEPDRAGAHRVGAVFQMQPEATLTRHLMMQAMHLGRPMLRRIVRGWEREAHGRPATVVGS